MTTHATHKQTSAPELFTILSLESRKDPAVQVVSGEDKLRMEKAINSLGTFLFPFVLVSLLGAMLSMGYMLISSFFYGSAEESVAALPDWVVSLIWGNILFCIATGGLAEGLDRWRGRLVSEVRLEQEGFVHQREWGFTGELFFKRGEMIYMTQKSKDGYTLPSWATDGTKVTIVTDAYFRLVEVRPV